MARNEIRKSGAGIRRLDSDILFSSWLYMPSDHEGFSRDAIKSMLPLLPTGMIPRKYLWEVENDRQRERTTKKSFRLIPITRCLDTLLCCNFSFSSFRHVYSCLFFYGERPLKTAKLFLWYWFGFEFLRMFIPFVNPLEQSDSAVIWINSIAFQIDEISETTWASELSKTSEAINY